MFDVWQVHSDTIICSDKPRGNNELPTKADAIFTNNPHVTLLMRFADCVPILIYDPIRKVVGIIHAGWQDWPLRLQKSNWQINRRIRMQPRRHSGGYWSIHWCAPLPDR